MFNGGATGMREARQEYFIGYAQDEWKVNPALTLNYGLRYDFYTPLREARNLDVLFDIDTGTLRDPSSDFFETSKTDIPAARRPHLRTGHGSHRGSRRLRDLRRSRPDRGSDPADRERSHQHDDHRRRLPDRSGGAARATSSTTRTTARYQPRAYANDYKVPERIYQYSVSVQRELPYQMVATVAYVGSQGRNLFLRSVANRIVSVQTNANPASNAIILREFDIVNPDGSILRPYAEVDYKTSGGHDSYNALQTSLVRRFNSGLTLNAQYTFGRSYGNTAGSNEALTAANLARSIDDFDYDVGYNTFDVRHTYNMSVLYSLPFGRGRHFASNWSGAKQALLGGWDVGAILNGRSGLPVQVQIVRPDIVYVDAAGLVYTAPAAGRSAIINTPGGGNSRNVRRPDIVPGVDPIISDGGIQWLNPAAFATPAPGTFGNMKRGSIRGPNIKQLDLVVDKRFELLGSKNLEFRVEVFNLFDTDNFQNPPATLPSVLGTGTNQLQPGQPYTQAAAGTFGRFTSTLTRSVGLGTNRQVQFALRFNF